jgi:hypothetical protein
MNFNEEELFGAALIGFDMIDGPFLKWKKEYDNAQNMVKLDDFAMNFYLAFRGGNASSKKPRAILYDQFYIVAFPKDLELCCLFMKPKNIDENIKQLNKIASRIISEMESVEPEDNRSEESDENTVEEIKRLIPNILSENKMTTPELRRYFKLSNSQIWKIMSDLENAQKIKRADKKGRSILWTAT